MSVSLYFTPQRVVAGRPARAVRRVGRRVTNNGAADTPLKAAFLPQTLVMGEQRRVTAMYLSGIAWSAIGAAFTLYINGLPADGYNAVPAALLPDTHSGGRVFTTIAQLDLTAQSAHPLPPGVYTARFMVTCANGDIITARGVVTIESCQG